MLCIYKILHFSKERFLNTHSYDSLVLYTIRWGTRLHKTSTHTLTPVVYIHWVSYKEIFMRLSQPWLRFLFIHFLTPLIVRYLSFQLQHPPHPPTYYKESMHVHLTLIRFNTGITKHEKLQTQQNMQHHTKGFKVTESIAEIHYSPSKPANPVIKVIHD